jgi:hypothetical protein
MPEHQDKLHTIITLPLVLLMDAKHVLLIRVNNNSNKNNNYMFSNKVLRKILGTMKADVGNLCTRACGYNDYLAYARRSGNKMQVFWDDAASIVKIAHISEKLADPIFLEYLDPDDNSSSSFSQMWVPIYQLTRLVRILQLFEIELKITQPQLFRVTPRNFRSNPACADHKTITSQH